MEIPDDEVLRRWVRTVFDAEVRQSPGDVRLDEWHHLSNQQLLAFITRVFEEPLRYLDGIDDDRIAQGLQLVINPLYTEWACVMVDDELAWTERQRCIEAIRTLFQKLLSKRNECEALNAIHYMSWDVFPTWGDPNDPGSADTDRALLGCMESILQIDSSRCQKSALHGLNHWQTGYPRRVAEIIDHYLMKNPNLSEDLRNHALWAKEGSMQ